MRGLFYFNVGQVLSVTSQTESSYRASGKLANLTITLAPRTLPAQLSNMNTVLCHLPRRKILTG